MALYYQRWRAPCTVLAAQRLLNLSKLTFKHLVKLQAASTLQVLANNVS